MKRNIYVMYLIAFLQGLVFYGPIATIYRQEHGLSMTNFFILESISWLLTLALEVPFGYFADCFGTKKTLIVSNFIFFLSKIIFWQSYSFGMFLLERILLSFALAGLSGCDTTLLYESVDNPDNTEKVFATYNNLATLGYLTSSFLFTFIYQISTEATAFFTIIPYFIASILTLFLIEINPPEKTKLSHSFKTAFSNKKLLVFIIAFALMQEVFQTITVILNQLQYERSNISPTYFGLILIFIQLANLSSNKSHKLSEKYGQIHSIQLLFSLMFLSCLSLIFTTNPIISVFGVLLISTAFSFCIPMMTTLQNKMITTTNRASILSIFAMLSHIVSATVNPIIGLGADHSIEVALLICSILALIGFLLSFSLKEHKKNQA